MRHGRSERGHQDRKQSDEAAELADEATAHKADDGFQIGFNRWLCHAKIREFVRLQGDHSAQHTAMGTRLFGEHRWDSIKQESG